MESDAFYHVYRLDNSGRIHTLRLVRATSAEKALGYTRVNEVIEGAKYLVVPTALPSEPTQALYAFERVDRPEYRVVPAMLEDVPF